MTDKVARPCPDTMAAEIAARLAKYGEADTFTSPSWEDVSTLLADRTMADGVIRGLLRTLEVESTLTVTPDMTTLLFRLDPDNPAIEAARKFVGDEDDKEGSHADQG